MSLGPHGPAVPSVTNASAPFLGLSFDAIRTSLNDLKDSTDVVPPLKSAVDAVLTVWDLAERVSTSDEHAEGLAWRAVCILDAIYNAIGDGTDPVIPAVLDAISTFVGLLHEISTTMEEELKPARLHLRRRKSRLAQFVTQLDVTFDAFKIGAATPTKEQLIPANPDQPSELQTQTVIKISHVSGGTGGSGGMGGRESGDGGPGYGPSFRAETITIQNCPPEYERLEKSNIRLATEVRVLHAEVRGLRSIVLFGLTPVSSGYLSGCAGAL
ncbi:hypothetical protein MSAN_00269800 [Mycena sanguinolenta]|uniref:Uncharacterized protein n=1 Tax=Mycena sanguinolenta TaxID=230812 RepID=A0A8H7DLF3_9AGAR|nr:hypothetical protein MSAN_00269800 [Mycena sanguinolenta]